jgi:hypothetical protein
VRGLVTIALKCIGVVVMIAALRFVVAALVLTSLDGVGQPVSIAFALWAIALAQVLFGLWLLLRAGRLAERWLPDTPLAPALAPRVILRLALVILGVVFVALAITGLAEAFSSGVITIWRDYEGSLIVWQWAAVVVEAAAPLTQLVVGGLLIAFSTRLSRVLWHEVPTPFAELSPRAGAAPPLTMPPSAESSPTVDVPRAQQADQDQADVTNGVCSNLRP